MLGRGGSLPRCGPTNLDLECKRAMEQILKPVHFQAILPWMQRADLRAKQDMARFLRILEESEAELADQRTGYAARQQPLLVNSNGLARTAGATPMTADRAQQDLLRNRHGSQQTDRDVQAKRQFFHTFAPVHSTATVDTYHRLQTMPVDREASAKALTEQARRQLQRWQVRGASRKPEEAALVMRTLKSISAAVAALPNYRDHDRDSAAPGFARTAVLHDYSKIAPKGAKPLNGRILSQLQPSASAPALLPPFRPFITEEQIDSIKMPGGDVVKLFDDVKLQQFKNRARATRSKVAVNGGERDWITTNGAHFSAPNL